MNTPKSWDELKEKWGGLAKIFGYDLDNPDDIKRLLEDSSIVDIVNNELSNIMMKMMERKQFRTWLEECIERCMRRINEPMLEYGQNSETIIEICSDIDKMSEQIKQLEDNYNKKFKQIENAIKATSNASNVIMK